MRASVRQSRRTQAQQRGWGKLPLSLGTFGSSPPDTEPISELDLVLDDDDVCEVHHEGHDAILCYRQTDGVHLASRVRTGLEKKGLAVFTDGGCGELSRLRCGFGAAV